MKKFVPILKWKAGERSGLSNLNENVKETITPIIEIVDDCSPEIVIKQLINSLNKSVYFDTCKIEDYGKSLLESLITTATSQDINCIPILYPYDLEDHFERFSSLSDTLAIKIELPVDISSPPAPSIIRAINALNDNSKNFDLIIDIGNVENSREAARQYSEVCQTLLGSIDNLEIFNNIIIASTSFPENISSIASDSITEFERYDIQIFKKILFLEELEHLRGKLVYSDYGVTKYQDTEIDFSKMNSPIINKIRYTTDDKYILFKGKNKNLTNPIAVKFPELSARLVRSKYYYGKNFSNGDLEIYNRSNGSLGPGNGTNWVATCINHHITVVVEQLSKIYDSLDTFLCSSV